MNVGRGKITCPLLHTLHAHKPARVPLSSCHCHRGYTNLHTNSQGCHCLRGNTNLPQTRKGATVIVPLSSWEQRFLCELLVHIKYYALHVASSGMHTRCTVSHCMLPHLVATPGCTVSHCTLPHLVCTPRCTVSHCTLPHLVCTPGTQRHTARCLIWLPHQVHSVCTIMAVHNNGSVCNGSVCVLMAVCAQ